MSVRQTPVVEDVPAALTAVPHSTSQGIWLAESTHTACLPAEDDAEGQLQSRGLAMSAGQQFLSLGFSCCVTSMPGICCSNGAVSRPPSLRRVRMTWIAFEFPVVFSESSPTTTFHLATPTESR